MFECKKPINRSMMIFGITMLCTLLLLMSIQSSGMLKAALDRRYDSHLRDIVTYLEHTVDADDLRECIRSGEPSEKYNALQQQVNTMVDDFEVMFIFIGIPKEDGTMVNVVSSTSEAERAAGDTEDFPIGYVDESYYTVESIKPYVGALKTPDRFSAFRANSPEFGSTYTVCRPVVTSDGETIALACAEMGLAELHRSINIYVWSSIALITVICIAFAYYSGHWMQRNIVKPLRLLEERTREFAENSRGKRDLKELTFNTPDIHTQNEIESLADAITQMSEDMKNYVEDILVAEMRADHAEGEAEDIARLAYEDALTHAGSRVAYDAKKAELSKQIAAGNAQFSLVAVNLMNAKHIDDIYGVDASQKYTLACCDILREVFPDSTLYRVVDDDFAVFLEGESYEKRDELYEALKKRFAEAQEDPQREPWERCVVASGMTDYIKDADENADQVGRRVEMIVFRNKRILQSEKSKNN